MLSKEKKIDIAVLILLPILAALISLAIEANLITSILLFLGVPSLFLSYKKKEVVGRVALFSSFSIPLAIIADYLVVSDQLWFVPKTVFPFRILGITPLENIIFLFLMVFFVTMFYENFFDKKIKHSLIDKRMKFLVVTLLILSVLFFTLLYIRPELLLISYAYFWIGLVIILIPIVLFLYHFPSFLLSYIKTTAYFFGLFFVFELVGLKLNQWTFPGTNFIGWVEIFGFRFPLEEVIFWFGLLAAVILSYYYFFDEGLKFKWLKRKK